MATPEWLLGPSNQTGKTRFGELPLFKEGLYNTADACYAWMVPNGTWGETNIGLIDCGGRSVMIDTCWDLNFTRELTSVVNTFAKRQFKALAPVTVFPVLGSIPIIVVAPLAWFSQGQGVCLDDRARYKSLGQLASNEYDR